jgi:hypothetical protein
VRDVFPKVIENDQESVRMTAKLEELIFKKNPTFDPKRAVSMAQQENAIAHEAIEAVAAKIRDPDNLGIEAGEQILAGNPLGVDQDRQHVIIASIDYDEDSGYLVK